MRPLLRCTLALLPLLAALPARASTCYLRWDACFGDGGTVNRQFACDTNTGSETMVASFLLTDPVSAVLSLDGYVNLAFADAAVPPWWQFRATGACRQSALAVTAALPAGASACADWADGTRDALSIYQMGINSPNTAQAHVTSPSFPGAPFDLAPGHYFAFKLVVSHQKTVGTGSCTGCLLGACMGLVRVVLNREAPNPAWILSPASPSDGIVTWQGGEGIAIPDFGGAGFTYCPGATPARSSTWGAVKSLYR